MALVIAVAGQKGGTGKSTVAVNLAAHWHERGLRVLLADADPQATAATWADVAAEHGHPAPPCVRLGDSLRRDLPQLAEAFDVVVVDVPGRAAGARQVGALLVADVVVLPCGPSAPDAWGLAASVEAVREVQELRPLLARILLNRADRTAMTRSAQDALAAVGLPVLARSLGARVAYAEALAAGRGVTVYAAGSVAAHELRQLAAELEQLAGLTTGDADHD
jgi:chromosome partitioning protein